MNYCAMSGALILEQDLYLSYAPDGGRSVDCYVSLSELLQRND